jgi:hypothetical protein
MPSHVYIDNKDHPGTAREGIDSQNCVLVTFHFEHKHTVILKVVSILDLADSVE